MNEPSDSKQLSDKQVPGTMGRSRRSPSYHRPTSCRRRLGRDILGFDGSLANRTVSANLALTSLLIAGAAPSSWARASSSPSHHLRRSVAAATRRSLTGGTCALGCGNATSSSSSSWCGGDDDDDTCQSAFAYCNRGGSANPSCFGLQPQAMADFFSPEYGWTNPIGCRGGILACELWAGTSECNTTLSIESRFVGLVLVDTDLGTLEFGLTDSAVSISAVHVYFGRTPLPLAANESFSLSLEDFPQKSWYHPSVRRSTLSVDGGIGAGDHFIAQVQVCPSPMGLLPTVAPSILASAPMPSPASPLCPLPAPPRSPFFSEVAPTVEPWSSSVAESSSSSSMASRTLQTQGPESSSSNVCASACRDEWLSCDARCQTAYMYCPDTNASCLFGSNNSTATIQGVGANVSSAVLRALDGEGWSNPVPCRGGSFACELWMGSRDCDRNSTASGNSLMVGMVEVNTDDHALAFALSALNYAISSVHVQVRSTAGDAASSSLQQQVWLSRNARKVTVALDDELRTDHAIHVQAHVCPISVGAIPPSPTPDPSSSIASPSPTAADPLCPISSPYGGTTAPSLELIIVPTVAVQTSEPTSVPTAAADAGDDGGSNLEGDDGTDRVADDGTDLGTDDGNDNVTADDTGLGEQPNDDPTSAPSCRPNRTPGPSPRPGPLLVLPPIFRPHASPPLSSSTPSSLSPRSVHPSQYPRVGRRHLQQSCEPDGDDNASEADDPAVPTQSQPTSGTQSQPTNEPSFVPFRIGSETEEPSSAPVQKQPVPEQPTSTKRPVTRTLEPTSKRVAIKPTFPPSTASKPSSQPTVTGAPNSSRAPTTSPEPSMEMIPTHNPTEGSLSEGPSRDPAAQLTTTSPKPSETDSGAQTRPPSTPPSREPEFTPSLVVTLKPTNGDPIQKTEYPSLYQSTSPTKSESQGTPKPSKPETLDPTEEPSSSPTDEPTAEPADPTREPSRRPVQEPESEPTPQPSRDKDGDANL